LGHPSDFPCELGENPVGADFGKLRLVLAMLPRLFLLLKACLEFEFRLRLLNRLWRVRTARVRTSFTSVRDEADRVMTANMKPLM
jgi:hypothetical protein